jgi:transcription initiation factor TFIID subunit 6
VQPLLHPPYPLHKPSFVPVYPDGSTGPAAGPSSQPQLYFLRDEEIDLVSYLKGIHPAAGSSTVNGKHIHLGGLAKKGRNAGVRWKSHWLAVEGVQPLIKENPISLIQEDRSGSGVGVGAPGTPWTANSTASATSTAQAARRRKLQASVAAAKTHLSQELLLFFTRITEALMPNPALPALRPAESSTPRTSATPGGQQGTDFTESERNRQASLATLRLDPSLSDLLPYLVRWMSEMIMVSISGGTEGRTTTELEYLLDGLEALVANPALFIEPYVRTLRASNPALTPPTAASNVTANHVDSPIRPARQRVVVGRFQDIHL